MVGCCDSPAGYRETVGDAVLGVLGIFGDGGEGGISAALWEGDPVSDNVVDAAADDASAATRVKVRAREARGENEGFCSDIFAIGGGAWG